MIATWIGKSLAPYRKYAVFSGRSDAAEYLAFCILQLSIFIAVLTAAPEQSLAPNEAQEPAPGWFVAYAFFWLASVVPWFALVARRFHDQGRSGKLAWLALAPWLVLASGPPVMAVILWLGLLVWLAMPGQQGQNEYGPPQPDSEPWGSSGLPEPVHNYSAVPQTNEGPIQPGVASRLSNSRVPVGPTPPTPTAPATRLVPENAAPAPQSQSQFEVSPGVRLGDDNHYHARGYSFTTLQQAEAYLSRGRIPSLPTHISPANNGQRLAGSAPSTPRVPLVAESLPQNSVLKPRSESQDAVSPGIWLGDDNRYHAKGYSFTTLQQAEAYLARSRIPSLPADTPRLSIDDKGSFPVQPPPAPPPTSVSPAVQSPLSGNPLTERWIAGPEIVMIAGTSITLELTYFGKAKDRYAWPSHNSLIDPTLAVAHAGSGDDLGYWPSYREMSQWQRRTYLDWLASGRSDPATAIGYVFVYFYGLERRLALDHAHAEATPILAELRRLYSIYGANRSFDRYATRLIEFAEYQTGGGDFALTPATAVSLQNGYELPLSVRVALGQALLDGGRLDADQALCWALAAPGSYLRTPGTRCFDELCELWRFRFAQSYPDGLKVRPGRRTVSGQYRPASGGYTAEIKFPELPDLASHSTERLQRLLEDCTTALDGYSRFLGRNPDLAQTIRSAAFLPPELRSGKAGKALAEARDRLGQIVGGDLAGRGGSTFAEVRAILSCPTLPAGEKIAARGAKDMADMLDALDFGFEPDRRFGKVGPLSPATPVALFSAPGGGHVDSENPAFVAARVMAEISALAAISDGVAVEEELRSVARDLAYFGLSQAETSRLLALVHAILIDPPHSRAAMRRALELPSAERTRIADAAIGAVLADGKVLPAEVRFLEALHKTLGLNADGVYSRLHRGAVEEELASVAPAVIRAGADIPEEERKKAAVAIDEGRLARIRLETSAASVLLSEIFLNDEESQQAARPAASTDVGTYPGLDLAHSQILDALCQGAITRADFDEITCELKLMPAGAIETINDWGFEKFGEAVLDDDDPVAIIDYLRDDIAAARGQG